MAYVIGKVWWLNDRAPDCCPAVPGSNPASENYVNTKKHIKKKKKILYPDIQAVLAAKTVPDRRSRIIPEVVLVSCWAVRVLGIWRGEGLGEGWGKGGQFTSNLRPRWTNPVTARRVSSK